MDENEECDCGTSYNCAKHEHCCIPYNGKNEPCRLDRNSGFECLAYEGFCCTKNCIYANLSDYNIVTSVLLYLLYILSKYFF